VLVSCWWTIDGSLSLFCSASFIPSFRMFTPRTHSSGPPHRRRKKSKCGHFKSSGCYWVLIYYVILRPINSHHFQASLPLLCTRCASIKADDNICIDAYICV
jgi:hypothetical protein